MLGTISTEKLKMKTGFAIFLAVVASLIAGLFWAMGAAGALGVLGLLALFAYVAFKIAYPTIRVRYRLTLEAEVDGEIATGNGVVEVSHALRPDFLPLMIAVAKRARGEAVALDIRGRGSVYALLRAGDDRLSDAIHLIPHAWGQSQIVRHDDIARLLAIRGKVDLPIDRLPALVRFRDAADPTSAEAVEPNDFEASFGPGVRLLRASMEITDDPITWSLPRRLRWLSAGDAGRVATSAWRQGRGVLGVGDFRATCFGPKPANMLDAG